MFKKDKAFIKDAIKHSVKTMLQQESDDWPPKCSIILYQPPRPKSKITVTEKKKSK